MVKIAVFASGSGSNALQLINHFLDSSRVTIALVVTNNKEAGVVAIANQYSIPVLVLKKEPFQTGTEYVEALQLKGIDFIVLAGFLWKIPASLITAYPGKIVNIHPALLPNYGGKGMYGKHVHEAVIANQEKESGITIHLVDEQYDHGKTIFQATCPVFLDDTAEQLAKRVQKLEHQHFPKVIESLLIS